MRTLYPAEDLARLTGVESFAQRETRFAGLRDFVDGPPKAGTLEEQLQAELEDRSGTDEWRCWVQRAAARHGIKSSGSAAAAARAAADPVHLLRDALSGDGSGTADARCATPDPTRLAPSSSTTTRRGES